MISECNVIQSIGAGTPPFSHSGGDGKQAGDQIADDDGHIKGID